MYLLNALHQRIMQHKGMHAGFPCRGMLLTAWVLRSPSRRRQSRCPACPPTTASQSARCPGRRLKRSGTTPPRSGASGTPCASAHARPPGARAHACLYASGVLLRLLECPQPHARVSASVMPLVMADLSAAMPPSVDVLSYYGKPFSL